MEAEQRIQALEQEVQILKTQIQSILLDIQSHLLTNAYPALRGHHTASSSSEDEDDDDEYDRAAPAPKVRKVSANSIPAKQEHAAPQQAFAEPEEQMMPPAPAYPVQRQRAMPQPQQPYVNSQEQMMPPAPAYPPQRQRTVPAQSYTAEPMLSSLDEQQQWVLQNIQMSGVSRTRDLIHEHHRSRRFSPEVSDTLLRFTDMYAAAADEPTLPTRPVGMPISPAPARSAGTPNNRPVSPRTLRKAVEPIPMEEPAKPTPRVDPKAAPSKPVVEEQPNHVQDENHTPAPADNDHSNVVLRLIAGVQNAGAGVRWGKNKS